MADSQVATKIYSTLGLGKQVSSSSHLSVLNSKVDFAPSRSYSSAGGALLSGSFLQSKYTQLGTGNYINRINNNNNSSVKGSPLNGHLRVSHDDRHKFIRAGHSGQREDGNRNLLTSEGCPPEPRKRLSDPMVVRLDWIQPAPRIGAGLANLGNTCFMNTVIQCLTYCPPLAVYLLQDPERHSPTCKISSFCMMCELQKHIKRALDKHGQSIRPTYMYQKLKSIAKHFQQGRQEDAHEFLRYVIDNLWKSALTTQEGHANLDPASKETTAINHIFGGYSRSQVVCLRCDGCSNTYDHFMDIILDIKGVSSLEGALKKFVEPEMLDNDNAYKCPKCNVKVKAEKKFTVYKAPNVATFQFKRFDYHRFNGGKITKHIDYPEKLNLRSYMAETTAESVWYRLNSVLVHAGHTCNSGHYYCYVRAPNNQWYRMDDTMVQPVGLNQVLHQQAYVLFYIRLSAQKLAPVKKPVVPFGHSPLNAEKNGYGGNPSNMNRPLSAFSRPVYVNSHSCSASRPLTNGTLATSTTPSAAAAVCHKLGGHKQPTPAAAAAAPPLTATPAAVIASGTKLSSAREKVSFTVAKNSGSSLVKVKGKPPEGSSSSNLAEVHHNSPRQVANKSKTLVPYTGDSSTSDSCSEPERKLPKLSNNNNNSAQIAFVATAECNGNAAKELSKMADPGSVKKVALLEFERPPDTLGNRSKSNNSWNICDANLESPSIASNSSNNSMNSTTADWNVTEQEGVTPRYGNRNYNGWAIIPTSGTPRGDNNQSSECLSRSVLPVETLGMGQQQRPSSKLKSEDERDKVECQLLLPFRATPQGGGGEATLCTKQQGLQQSSQHSLPFGRSGQASAAAAAAAASGKGPAGDSAATPVAFATSSDGKRKRPEPASGRQEGHRTVPKRHKSEGAGGGDVSSRLSPSKVTEGGGGGGTTPGEGGRQLLSKERRRRKVEREERSRRRKTHQPSSSGGSSSSGSGGEVWEERTKDTIERERQQRLETASSNASLRNADGSDQPWRCPSSTWTKDSSDLALQNLISNGGRGYGSAVRTWDGSDSRLASDADHNKRKRFSDNYNEELDRGKVRKDKGRQSLPNNFFTQRNPFQREYDRNHHWSLNGQQNSWHKPLANEQYQEKQQQRGTLHYLNHGEQYHRGYHHPKQQQHQQQFHHNHYYNKNSGSGGPHHWR